MYWGELAESDLAGTITDEYIFFGGKRIARRIVVTSTIHYYFADHLGSSRIVTNASGGILEDSDFYPFGGERVVVDSTDNRYKFTGKERDPESGLDYFGARYYASLGGRFLSADWSTAPSPVPFADFGNPQTLNLYAYVKNNPLNATDPDGHCCFDWDGAKNVVANAGASARFLGQEFVGGAKALVNIVPQAYNLGVTLLVNVPAVAGGMPENQLPLAPTLEYNNLGEQVGGAVVSLGLAAVPLTRASQATVTRYMGDGEAATATTTGAIPNTNALGKPRPTHVTTDAPLNSAGAAQARYELSNTPTHRATVPANRAGQLQTPPDGRTTTSGGGSQAATSKPILVKPDEIKPLKD